MLARAAEHSLTITRIVAWILAILVVTFAWSSIDPRPASGAGPNSIVSPDTTGDVGRYSSIIVDEDGNPVVVYYDNGNGDLELLHCGDPNCSSGNSIASPDTTGDVGSDYPSIVLDSEGFPVVSYFDLTNGNLKVLHCGNANCTAGNSVTTPDTGGANIVGPYASIALDASGFPVISYSDVTNFDLKVMHCNDVNCAGGGESITTPDTTGLVGVYTSIELDSAGFPVVSYYDSTNANLKVVHCGNANCSAGNTITSPDTTGDVGYTNSLELDSAGFPVISYKDNTNGDLKVLHCGNANCTAGNSIFSPDTAGDVGLHTSLALDASGFPVVSYYNGVPSENLTMLRCGNANCTAGNTTASPDTTGIVGEWTSVALDSFGLPTVSYYDRTNGNLKVLHCGNTNCTAGAPSFTVNSTSDAVDATPGNGVCATGVATCTLRAAIQEANALAGTQTILLPGGTYTLTIAGSSEDASATGDLDVASDLTIKGAGANSTIIDANALDRAFDVTAGDTATLSGMTITGGALPGGQGGGGVENSGTLTLTRVAVTGNTSIAGGGGLTQHLATMTIADSTISNNTSDTCCAAMNNSSSTLTITNSTISGNETDGFGGGIRTVGPPATVQLNNVTIAENRSDADSDGSGSGGGLFHSTPTITIAVKNSIIARNSAGAATAPDCVGPVTSAGYNLLGNNSGCTFTSTTGDLIGTGASPIDPLFGRLRNNGGPTETHAISVVSPAIDAGNPATPGSGGSACAAADQRGQARPLDGDSDTVDRCDIGAYERQGAAEETCTPPSGGVCDDYRFNMSLDVSIDPTCTASGDLRTERGPTANGDADAFDDVHVEFIYLDGYVTCPGDFFLGSSIPDEGTIEELKNNQPGVLEFPATGTFSLCVVVASHPFGDLHNCPDSFPPSSKDPLIITCTIASLSKFSCSVVGVSTFYNDSNTPVANVESGTASVRDDTDQDGCSDAAEQNANPGSQTSGGLRNYLNFWDFYDTPDTSNVRDRAIAGTDFFRLLARFGSTGSTVIDPLSPPQPAPAYHPAFDRGPASGDPWDLTAASGSVAGSDFFALLVQFGHSCV